MRGSRILLTLALIALATSLYAQFAPVPTQIIHPTTGLPMTPLATVTESAAGEAGGGVLQPVSAYLKAWNGATFGRILADPCETEEQVTDTFSITTDTVIITATAAKKNYICSMLVIAGAAEIVSITEGTGTVCGTSEAALLGSTTDANGGSLAANGGFPWGTGAKAVVRGKTANVDTCANVSGSNRVVVTINWVKR